MKIFLKQMGASMKANLIYQGSLNALIMSRLESTVEQRSQRLASGSKVLRYLIEKASSAALRSLI